MAVNGMDWSEDQRRQIATALDGMLTNPLFLSAARQRRLLKFLIETALENEGGRLNQYTIAIDVFDRDESFDPAIDSIVRVEAARLRSKLRDYYDEPGRADPVRFEVPKGSYSVKIGFRDAGAGPNGVDNADLVTTARPDIGLSPQRPVIAVLPFDNMSGDREQEYFADGITEDLITDLSKLSGLAVIARNSVFTYKGKAVKIEELARDLGAAYVLRGSVRKAADRVRINVHLVETGQGRYLWAERYDRELCDIFAVQDDVTENIVAALAVTLTRSERTRIRRRGTDNLEAYDCVLRGQQVSHDFSRTGSDRAQAFFRRAVELDPGYAEAHARLAASLSYRWLVVWSGEQGLNEAYEAATRAIELDEQSAVGHATRGWIRYWRDEYDDAITELKYAVALDPSATRLMEFLSLCLAFGGRAEEATQVLEQAMRLNPHEPYYYPRSVIAFSMDRIEEAVELLEKSTARFENFLPSRVNLAICYGLLGREHEGRRQVAEIRRISPEFLFSDWAKSWPSHRRESFVREEVQAACCLIGLE